jgi:putative restriction endonuclease
MPLSPEKRFLLARVQDAIYASGWSVLFENDEHPTELRAFRGQQTIRLLVYIWRLTPGGPPGVRPAGELRIQLTGIAPPLRLPRGFKTLLLGWHEATGVFAAFDVTRRPTTWGMSPSVQIRSSAIDDAAASGFGTYRRATAGRGEIAVAFSPEAFMDYVVRQGELHQFADYPNESAVLRQAARGAEVDLDRIAGSGRRQAIRTVMERIGQGNFRSRILAVYRHRCVVCEIQLDLVGAAHIVPVTAGGDNSTVNGLALCYLHHEAYDRGIVGITPEYSIVASEAAHKRLVRLARTNRWDDFRGNLRREIVLPERARDYPDRARLAHGLQLRGWVA